MKSLPEKAYEVRQRRAYDIRRARTCAIQLITEKNPVTVDTDKTTQTAAIRTEELPESALTSLIRVLPATSMFSGWGPRMETSISTILRGRN